MALKKILVVFGATGNQGGSAIKAILGDPATAEEYQIRAITRDPTQPAAAALASEIVTVVKADLDNKDSLRAVLKDANAVFLVTNFHERMDKDYEVQQGINVADVAKECNVQHLIFSGAPYVSKISKGKYTKVAHFDGKGIIEEHIRSIGIPATFLLLAFFMHSALQFGPGPTPKSYKMALPVSGSSKWPLVAVAEDAGKYVKAILLNREKLLGQRVFAAQGEFAVEHIAALVKEKGGVDVTFEQIPEEHFRVGMKAVGLPEFFVEDLLEMIKYVDEFGYYGEPGIEEGRKILTEPLITFEDWIPQSKEVAALK